MSDDLEPTEEIGIEPEAIADELVAAGRQKLKEIIRWCVSVAVGIAAALGTNFALSAVQNRVPVEITGVLTPTPVAASAIQPAPADINRPAVQVVEVQPQETEADRRIMQILHQLTTAVDNLAAEVHVASGAQAAPAGPTQDVGTAAAASPLDVVAAPMAAPEPALSIWEDGGGCWTPADISVLHLCGADAGDGYVIRWIGLPGDSRGPEIPDSDYLAVRGGGDRLVWSGNHPATGEAVTVTYWAAGHVLAVHAAGRLLFRIDRNHGVIQ